MEGKAPVEIVRDQLVLGPVTVGFHRTLRIPETGLHPLPPGLGRFPLRRVEDYPDTAPAEWLSRGGVMLPIYQREAMWLSFDAFEPAALQVGTGKVCAVSGLPWIDRLVGDPQNYVCAARSAVAGRHQRRGRLHPPVRRRAARFGRDGRRTGHRRGDPRWSTASGGWSDRAGACRMAGRTGGSGAAVGMRGRSGRRSDGGACGASMGLGAGGRMRQEVYADDRPLSDYDESGSLRVFVHLCSAAQWSAITGEVPPPTPVDRDAYVRAGLPWFDFYDADARDLAASDTLSKVKSVSEKLGLVEDPHVAVDPSTVIALKGVTPEAVTDGTW